MLSAKRPAWALIVALPVALALLSLFSQARLNRAFFATAPQRAANCDGVLKAGRYLDGVRLDPRAWQPDGCTLHDYGPSCARSSQCLAPCLQPGDEIIVAGDSTARQIFFGLSNTLQQGSLPNKRYYERTTRVINNITLTFVWTYYFNETTILGLEDIAQRGMDSEYKAEARANYDPATATRPPKTYLVVTAGLWFTRAMDPANAHDTYLERLQHVFGFVDKAKPGVFEHAYYFPTMMPYFAQYSGANAKLIRPAGLGNFLRTTDTLFGYERGEAGQAGRGGVVYKTEQPEQPLIYYVPVVDELGGENHRGLSDGDGSHFTGPGRFLEANIVLNHICNNAMAATNKEDFSATCCVEYAGPDIWRAAAGAAVLLALAAWKRNAMLVLATAATAGYIYVAANTHAFVKTDLVHDSRDLPVLAQLILFAGLLSATKLPDDKLLLVRELQGLCALGAVAVKVSGYDRVLQTFQGVIFERVFVACWSALHVYVYVRELADAEKSLVFAAAERAAELLVLPLVIALSSGTSGLPPLAVAQLLWCVLGALALAATRATLPLLLSTGHSTARAIQGAALTVAAAAVHLLLPLPAMVERDFWVAFAALAAAVLLPPHELLRPSRAAAVAATTGLVVLANTLMFAWPVYFPVLQGAKINTSAVEASGAGYVEALAARGTAYTTAAHTAACVAALGLCGAARAALLARVPSVYADAYLAVARCAYELLLLRDHALLTRGGALLLYLLPGGTGTVLSGITQRALGLYPAEAAYRMFEYPGEVAREAARFVNLAAVAGVCGLAAMACAPQMYTKAK